MEAIDEEGDNVEQTRRLGDVRVFGNNRLDRPWILEGAKNVNTRRYELAFIDFIDRSWEGVRTKRLRNWHLVAGATLRAFGLRRGIGLDVEESECLR